jgi:predicted MPP superfamily phosphohydrolase
MWPALPADLSFAASAIVFTVGAATVRVCLPDVARTTLARGAGALLGLVIIASHASWVLPVMPYWGAMIASIVLCLMPLVVISVPIAGLVRRVGKVAVKPVDLHRRAILGVATAAAPAVALGAGISGFTTAAAPPRVPRVRFEWDDLPAELDGLRVLQLSDLHLGVERHVEDVEALFERIEKVDLVVFTGDVAEDVRQLRPVLDAAVRFGPRLGVFASLGNHEYLHDIDATLRVYRSQRDVPLLVSSGTRVRAGRAEIWLGGADDPVFTNIDPTPFLEESIARSMADAPVDAFRMLLCHRPEGFVPASAMGVRLVLAGHTHGGQIGFNGKSAFEPIWRDKYLWGRYERGNSRLYTTSGFGHWFPFRLLCPTEAPIVELGRRVPSPA